MGIRVGGLASPAAIALMVAVAVGCSSPAPPHEHPTTTSAARPTVTRAATRPAIVVPLARQQIARVTIPNPDALVAALGFIWVKTDDGRVVKIDPQTNRVIARHKLDTAKDPQHYCQGIGTDGRSVWVCAASDTTTDLVRINPHSLRPVLRVAADKAFDQEHLPYVGGRLWVLSGGGKQLLAVNTSSGALNRYPLPATCAQAAGADSVLVVTCPNDNAVLRIDPVHGSVVARRTLQQPGYCAVLDNQVWVDTVDGIERTDGKLRTTALYPALTVGLTGDLAGDQSGAIWVRQEHGFLYRIEPAHNAVVEQITTSRPLSGGSILITGDSIWTSAYDDSTVFHLRRG
jgi:streptogramin lyase